ncbi:hypothetical protein B0H14DRAFT_2558422 [Mycena olivaceomarginata]|nr:hypothetical protein B0H14DRAFT_2558422 [Mycena olivaceomarginata]
MPWTSLLLLKPFAVGSATILLYDHLITIDQEHRYLGLACVLIELYGEERSVLSGINGRCGPILWNMQILAALGVLFIAEMVSVVVILAQSFAHPQITATFAPGLGLTNFCSLSNTPDFFYWYWLPVLIYNTPLSAELGELSCVSLGSSGNPELNQLTPLVRIFAVFFLCCVFWIVGDFSLRQIPVGFVLSFSITNSTRLLINIRHAYYSQEEMDLDRPSGPTIYANQAPPEEWLFELRALKLG